MRVESTTIRLDNVESFHISSPPAQLHDPRYLRLILALTVSQAAKAMEDGLNVKYSSAGKLFNGRYLDEDLLYIQVRVPKKPFVDFWIGSRVNVELELNHYVISDKDVAVAYLTYMKRTNPTMDDLLSRLDKALVTYDEEKPVSTFYREGDVVSFNGKDYIVGYAREPRGALNFSWHLRLDRKYERSVYINH